MKTPYQQLIQVVNTMEELGRDLPEHGLKHVLPFNESYRLISIRIGDGIKMGEFEDPAMTAEVAEVYAERYVHAAGAHVQGDHEHVPNVWLRLFRDMVTAPRVEQFAVGANAHIGYDLPHALEESSTPASFRSDFLRINSMIADVSPELVPSVLDNPSPRVSKLIALLSNSLFAQWRSKSWQLYTRYKDSDIPSTLIERFTLARSERIHNLTRIVTSLGVQLP